MIDLRHGDCLDLMTNIPDGSVDAIIADLPYGSTQLKWDQRISLEPLWSEFKRLIKPRGAIVLFADFRFAVSLYNAAPKGWFRYEWVWAKNRPSGFLQCKNKPMPSHEFMLVFSDGTCANRSPYVMTYNPQGLKPGGKQTVSTFKHGSATSRPDSRPRYYATQNQGYPWTVINFSIDQSGHPTQKPLALLEYLVKTYTNEGETVLDPTMGSGTCGHACVNTGRRFIGIEKDADYFAVASKRLAEAASATPLFTS